MKTTVITKATQDRQWVLVDGENQVLGRLATQISKILQGKHKANYTPHMDNGDFIVVINAEKIRVTGNKALQKKYYRYTGYPGGLREVPFEKMKEQKPEQILKLAVKRMMPKTRLGRKMLKKLKIYPGPEHPHAAQNPKPINPVKSKSS
ncbi:MAG: 50S ribosomal protein L13 [Planctomycetota bacterium]|nr:MAG: 50S ribosomal protein L13 [Planctomycetota bacterium]